MCELGEKAVILGGQFNGECPTCWEVEAGSPCPDCHQTSRPVPLEMVDYALLVLATDTEVDRAIQYLKDTGSPLHASGRLLLRAAEKALRSAGDVD